MMRRAYQTDLSDAEWALIEPHLPAPRAPGRPRDHPLREILDAVFYVVRGGEAMRCLKRYIARETYRAILLDAGTRLPPV